MKVVRFELFGEVENFSSVRKLFGSHFPFWFGTVQIIKKC